ncbi:MAG TPA: HEAT repeat domain-containing protein [Planctomycetota bacterium]|nr:HEAT repeat domain-containing protein [Planctomycetota bacterium]
MGCGWFHSPKRSSGVVALLLCVVAGTYSPAPLFAQGKGDDGPGGKPKSRAPEAPTIPSTPIDPKPPQPGHVGGSDLPQSGGSRNENTSKPTPPLEPTQIVWRLWLDRNLYRYEPQPVSAADAHSGLPPHLLDLSLRAQKRDLYRTDVAAALRNLLHDPDDRVRGVAAISLARVGAESNPEDVGQLLSDGHRKVRDQTLLASALADGSSEHYHLLRCVAGEAADVGATAGDRDRARAVAAILLAARGERSVPRLLGDWVVDRTVPTQYRALAIQALGLSGNPDAADRLVALARDHGEPGLIRSTAVAALGQLGVRATAPAVLQFLEERDLDTEVRTAAALALGSLVDPNDAVALRSMLKAQEREGNALVVRFLLLSLGEIGGRTAELRIDRMLERPSADERTFAHLALGLAARRSGAPQTAAPLFDALRDARLLDEKCGLAIALGLTGQLRALEPLADLALRGSSPDLRAYAVTGLYLLARPGCVAVLTRVMNDDDNPDVRMQSARTLARLDPVGASALIHVLHGARGPTTGERAAYIESLGLTRDPTALEPLLALLKDGKAASAERVAATLALGLVYEPRTAPPTARIGEGANFLRESTEVPALLSLAE